MKDRSEDTKSPSQRQNRWNPRIVDTCRRNQTSRRVITMLIPCMAPIISLQLTLILSRSMLQNARQIIHEQSRNFLILTRYVLFMRTKRSIVEELSVGWNEETTEDVVSARCAWYNKKTILWIIQRFLLRREASRGKTETKLKDRLHGRANRRKRTMERGENGDEKRSRNFQIQITVSLVSSRSYRVLRVYRVHQLVNCQSLT